MNSHISDYGLGLRASVSECRVRGLTKLSSKDTDNAPSDFILQYCGLGFWALGFGPGSRPYGTLQGNLRGALIGP